ncbi:MAG: hypothetical protein ACFFDN_07635 [Candidatus Hodarchaeota archaeon]
MKKKILIQGAVSLFIITSILIFCCHKKDDTPVEEVNYQICCWNLEHFSSTASRGFPESPGIPPRTEEQLNALVSKLTNEIIAEIYLFSEIEEENYLANLVNKMGPYWKYDIGISGSQQKTAFVWNTKAVKEIKAGDILISDTFFDSSRNRDREIFDRDPQLLHIVFLDEQGNEKNDALLIGLHMISGERWNKERQRGMEILLNRLPNFLSDNGFDTNEKDIIFLGDLNDDTFLKFYDTRPDDQQLQFLFPYMVSKGYIALVNQSYPGTRISGRQIDHIIISSDFDPECIMNVAKILVPSIDYNQYRVKLTDHFPVLVNVTMHEDDD